MYSVVIPVYNAKSSLKRCVDSWLAQSRSDLELLLVDDGSTDGSAGLCDELADSDPRIRVIHQKNSGVSAARNAGIQEACGEYVLFTDSDDYVAVDYLEKMANCVDNAGADLALCGFHHLFEGADIPKSPRSGVWELQHFKETFLELYSMSYLNMPWNKLYRKDLMGTFDTSLSLGEDLLFNLDYLSRCRKIAVLSDRLCYYIQDLQKTSLSSVVRTNRLELARRVCEAAEAFYKKTWGECCPNGQIFTRYMNEVLDECEKLPLQKELSYQEKIETIRQYAQDDWVRTRGGEARLTLTDYRILFPFLRNNRPRMVYALCVMRNWLVTIVHWIRRRER